MNKVVREDVHSGIELLLTRQQAKLEKNPQWSLKNDQVLVDIKLFPSDRKFNH